MLLTKTNNNIKLNSKFYPSNTHRLFSNYKDQTKHDIIIICAGCVGQGVAASFLQSNQ